jgi:tetratricopeptide (TPR) repeat protein
MRRLGWLALLAAVGPGCVSTDDERLHEYTADGVLLYQNGVYDGARQTFEAALAMKPGDANLTFNLGRCYDRLGDGAKAEESYRQCLQRSADHADAMHSLTALLVRENRRAEADRLVDDWVRRSPNSAAAYAEFGWLCRRDRDLPQALAACQHAYELDSHNVRALSELAQCYEAMNRPDRALTLYERSLQYQPEQPEVVRRVSLLKEQGAGRPHPD